jgi:hypothetical protein
MEHGIKVCGEQLQIRPDDIRRELDALKMATSHFVKMLSQHEAFYASPPPTMSKDGA